jgi:hypothetical protein
MTYSSSHRRSLRDSESLAVAGQDGQYGRRAVRRRERDLDLTCAEISPPALTNRTAIVCTRTFLEVNTVGPKLDARPAA